MLTRREPIISVIIPTYNRSRLLDYTLHSLTTQSLHRDSFEVIIADDGSFDNTRSVVDAYRDRLRLKYFFQEDLGYRPGSARNMGIRNAEGEICVFIDSGVILGGDCLAEHLRSHEMWDCPVGVVGYVYGFDQENGNEGEIKEIIRWQDPDATLDAFRVAGKYQDIREAQYRKYNYAIHELPAPWIFFWTCNVSARREDLFLIGLFDENYDGVWGCEDADLAYRMHNSGVKIILNIAATSVHYPHPKDAAEKFKLTQRNRIYFDRKFNTVVTRMVLDARGNDCIDLNDKILSLSNAVL